MKNKILILSLCILAIFSACSKNSSGVATEITEIVTPVTTDTAIIPGPPVVEGTTMLRYPSATDDTWSVGDGWNLAWGDEFSSPQLNMNNWTFQKENAGKFNNEWQAYTDSNENSYVYTNDDKSNGYMVIEAKYNGNGLKSGNFSSARMITHNKQKFQYGKIAARIQVPYGQGIWPAFWMLGSNISENAGGTVKWPDCGEIDIMEKIGGSIKEKTLYGTVHYWKDSENRYDYITGNTVAATNLSDAFHVYEVEWDPSTIIWKLDGKEYNRQNISSSDFNEFKKEFYIILNLAVGGNWPGNPDSTTVFSQYMFVDWVRVYQK